MLQTETFFFYGILIFYEITYLQGKNILEFPNFKYSYKSVHSETHLLCLTAQGNKQQKWNTVFEHHVVLNI